jgi:hypothetical protein
MGKSSYLRRVEAVQRQLEASQTGKPAAAKEPTPRFTPRKRTLAEQLGIRVAIPVDVRLPETSTTPREIPVLYEKPKPAIPRRRLAPPASVKSEPEPASVKSEPEPESEPRAVEVVPAPAMPADDDDLF